MPRTKALEPKHMLRVYVNPTVLAELKLVLFDPTYVSGFRFGELSSFVEAAIREKIDRLRIEVKTATEPQNESS